MKRKHSIFVQWSLLFSLKVCVRGVRGWGHRVEVAAGLGPHVSRVGVEEGCGERTRSAEPSVARTCCYGDTM